MPTTSGKKGWLARRPACGSNDGPNDSGPNESGLRAADSDAEPFEDGPEGRIRPQPGSARANVRSVSDKMAHPPPLMRIAMAPLEVSNEGEFRSGPNWTASTTTRIPPPPGQRHCPKQRAARLRAAPACR